VNVTRGRFSFDVVPCAALPGFWEDFYAAGWEEHTTDLIERLVTPGSVFVDVGAWIGPLALYAAALGARVIAVEPDPAALHELALNIAANEEKFDHPISVWRGAVVATEGDRARIASHGVYGNSMTHLSAEGIQVEAWTLPRILAEAHVDPAAVSLAKIDVEGYERALMPSLGPWLGSHGIPAFVSFHGKRLDKEWFSAYAEVTERVEYVSSRPRGPWGDLTALPRSEEQ
jgi:FkbM family methyltransferase